MFMLLLYILSFISYFVNVKGQTALAAATSASINSTYELEVFNLVNNVRSKGAICGGIVKPAVLRLTWNQSLANAARGHSIDMANKNYFSHTSLDGRTFVDRVRAAGYYPYRTLCENIAAGYNTASAVMNGWMSSTGHCNNIMNPSFKEIGVGYAFNSLSTYDYYWTQDFGAR